MEDDDDDGNSKNIYEEEEIKERHPNEEETYEDVRATNIVATGKLDRKLDTRKIAEQVPGTIYHSADRGGLRIYLVDPSCSITIQSTGRVSVMGTKSIGETYLAFCKVIHLLRMYSINVKASQQKIEINNFVSTGQIPPVNLILMAELKPFAVRYDHVRFAHAALVNVKELGYKDSNVVMEVFQSGKVNIPGARSKQECKDVFEFCKKELFSKVRIRDTVTTGATLLEYRPAKKIKFTQVNKEEVDMELKKAIEMNEEEDGFL